MPSPQVNELAKRIFTELPNFRTLDAAVESVRQFLISMDPALAEMRADDLEEARRIVEQELENVEILHKNSLTKVRNQWYFGPVPGDRNWPALKNYMLNEKGWDKDDVTNIDKASNEVVSLLENPRDPEQKQFSCRGLVVGHVQSGKTANMAAVIAKAMDVGYNTVIVLAGLTNKLRYQTQMRFYNDLVRRYPLNWQVLTPNEINRDFRAPPQGGFLSHTDKCQIAVVKKNVSPLRELARAIEQTIPAALQKLRILVIDDECDQASVNSATKEFEVSSINSRIRDLLAKLPAVTYVGYTATPFANVLINPYTDDHLSIDDLYPRDFITALPRSDSYFGTEELFGKNPDDPDQPRPDEEGLDMIRSVPDTDELLLQPRRQQERETFEPEMADSLEAAILYFLSCCAARRARGDANKHMTMLVHTSAYIAVHNSVADLIESWVTANRGALLDQNGTLGKRISDIWINESNRLPDDLCAASAVSVEQIFEHLPDVLDAVEFPVENGASDERIDYEKEARTYIVTGGSILARGLTLEGLMVSYFLRSANQYDTLLQMGRWFGYRPGYEDLPRIWMPDDLSLKFRAMATIENEIRGEIRQYQLNKLTPMDVAVKIRAIPGMAITAAAKMRAARQCDVSYWGTHKQTFRFESGNPGKMLSNWTVAGELVSDAERAGVRDADASSSNRKLWRNVPKSVVETFFKNYKVEPSHAELAPEILTAFLQQSDSRLDYWNIGIVEPRSGNHSQKDFGGVGKVRMVNRAKLKDSGKVADIKALMSRSDIWFDCAKAMPDSAGWDDLKESRQEDAGHVPLLLLYPIDRNSRPRNNSKVRVGLDATEDVIGYGVVFPGSTTEGGNYVSVTLNPPSADELEEIEEEEREQLEAAGVES